MKIVFVGNVVPEEIFNKISSVSPSTNNVELSYIKMLKEQYKENLYVISQHLGTAKLVNNSEKHVPEMVFHTEDGVEIQTVSFNNTRLLLNISAVFSLTRKLKKLRSEYKNEMFVFVVNNHFYGWALPVFLTKRHHDIMVSILNEAFDVKYLREHKIGLKDWIQNVIHKYLLKHNDGIITFNEATVLRYAPEVPFISLLHSCDEMLFDNINRSNDNKQYRILYAGSLNPCYGIDNLIKAMDCLPECYKLTVCGGGDENAEARLRTVSSKNKRIEFLGMVPRHKVLRLEKNSDALVIIRVAKTPSEKYLADYCQPSKLAEYMLSGVPIIATDILGIPKTMKPYLNFTGEKPVEIAETIINVCDINREESLTKSASAVLFARENCTYSTQKKLICGFVDSIIGEYNDNK